MTDGETGPSRQGLCRAEGTQSPGGPILPASAWTESLLPGHLFSASAKCLPEGALGRYRTEKSVIKSQRAWFFDKGATSVRGLSGIPAIPYWVAISRDFNDGYVRGTC